MVVFYPFPLREKRGLLKVLWIQHLVMIWVWNDVITTYLITCIIRWVVLSYPVLSYPILPHLSHQLHREAKANSTGLWMVKHEVTARTVLL